MALSLEPGYLDFDNLPDTNFTCVGKVIGGYYADLEANCQMFHVCTIGQADEPMDIRFLCLNGTVFDQETRVCERIDEVDCSKSEQFYSLNLELYGNSGPILEESPEVAQETEVPSIIIKSTTSTTTTTTTTTKRPVNRPTSPPYYSTNRPSVTTTAANKPKVVSTHHFPVNGPDIRFNPEEINISLNPGAPPDIRTKHFLQQSFSDSIQDLVNDNANIGESLKVQNPERLHVSSSTSPKSIYGMDHINNQKLPQNSENNFAFSGDGYQTELPQRQQQFLIQTNSFRHSQSFPPNVQHLTNQYHHQHFHSTTAKQNDNYHQDLGPTTLRTIYLHSLKPPEIHQHHHYTHHHRTEKPPQRVQIPIPLLPNLPPLTFSSPAPFTLQRHIESKRYTKDHQAPPRIIISASASVSDASGRRLNYSLGTIGAAQLLEAPPSSYDDYKDSDVGLDPFYHDVPKVNQNRRKRRSAEQKEEKINPFEVIKDEKEAVEVLKFLFTWYQSHQATATVPSVTSAVTRDLIHKINYELAAKDSDSTLLTDSSEIHFTSSKEPTSTESIKPGYENNELFKKNGRYSIVGGYKNLDSKPILNNKTFFIKSAENPSDKHIGRTRAGKNIELDDLVLDTVPDMRELKEKLDDSDITIVKDLKEDYLNPYDYVDDNYEGIVYKEMSSNGTKQNETNTYLPKEEENIETKTDSTQYKSSPVNQIAVEELYKYLNINQYTTTEQSMIDTFTDINSENENTEYYKHEITNNKNKQDIDLSEPLVKDTSYFLNDTDTSNESVKFADINVLSEVRQDDDTLKSSTSTSSTTTTTDKPNTRKVAIRRGRGRQKQRPNNYNDAQKNFNSSLESRNSGKELEKEKTDLHFLAKPNSTSGPLSKRGKARGRSRFSDFHSSASTTTTVSSTSETISESQHSESNDFSKIAFATLTPLLESINESETTLENLKVSTPTILTDVNFSDKETTTNGFIVDQPNTFETDISEPTLNSFLKESSEKNIFVSELENIFVNSKNKSSEDLIFYDDIRGEDIYNISKPYVNPIKDVDEVSKIEENQFNDSDTETTLSDGKTHYIEKQYTTEQLRSGYETTALADSELIHVETSAKPSINEEQQTQFNDQEDIIDTTKVPDSPGQVEASTRFAGNINEEVGHSSKMKDASSLIPEFNPVVNTAEDPSYLIKLLRYFAESAKTTSDDRSTETPVESYNPLTESQPTTTTTEKNIGLDIRPGRTEHIKHNRGRQRSKHRYAPKVSTTNLPTLRDVYKYTERSTEIETKNEHFEIPAEIPDKLENNNLDEIINTTIVINNHTEKLPLNMTEPELEDSIHVKSAPELLERLSLVEQKLSEDPNENPVTNAPIVDSTVTTPFISFEHAESFGTTISSITDSSKYVDDNTEGIKDLTEMFETSTKSKHLLPQSGPTEANKNYYSFYEDAFVVPELTEKTSYSAYTEANKYAEENTETTYLLESTSTLTSGRSDQNILSTPSIDISKVSGTKLNSLDSLSSSQIADLHDATTSVILKLENDLIESNGNKDELHKLDSSTLQSDVEIQKSISLPVTILENTFDVSQDINNAQDINNLIPTSTHYETPENLQEYIEDIEVSTKGSVAKGDQVKLGFTDDNEVTATETIPTTLVTTDATTLVMNEATISSDEHIKNPNYSIVPEIQHNATEILLVKETESSKTLDSDSTTNLPTSMVVEPPGMINSSHLLRVVVETATVETTTAEPATSKFTSTRIPFHTRRTRPPKRRPYNNQKSQFGRHRFSTELFTNKPPKYNEAQYKQNQFTSKIESENITDAPLYRSATPTRSELKKVALHTTPLSSKNSRVTPKVNKQYVFNCFGKDKNKFYADPRDCRLFHYCTQGYSKNQLLDLKFVCDQKTFFDDVKLTCTKVKPTRCV